MLGLAFQFNKCVSLDDHIDVRLSTGLVTNVTGLSEHWIVTLSPSSNLKRVAPSKDTQALDLPSIGFFSVMITCSGKISGLKERECGAKGVSEMAGTLLYIMEPPAAKL